MEVSPENTSVFTPMNIVPCTSTLILIIANEYGRVKLHYKQWAKGKCLAPFFLFFLFFLRGSVWEPRRATFTAARIQQRHQEVIRRLRRNTCSQFLERNLSVIDLQMRIITYKKRRPQLCESGGNGDIQTRRGTECKWEWHYFCYALLALWRFDWQQTAHELPRERKGFCSISSNPLGKHQIFTCVCCITAGGDACCRLHTRLLIAISKGVYGCPKKRCVNNFRHGPDRFWGLLPH